MGVLGYILWVMKQDEVRADRYIHLENGGLYWHLVDRDLDLPPPALLPGGLT